MASERRENLGKPSPPGPWRAARSLSWVRQNGCNPEAWRRSCQALATGRRTPRPRAGPTGSSGLPGRRTFGVGW